MTNNKQPKGIHGIEKRDDYRNLDLLLIQNTKPFTRRIDHKEDLQHVTNSKSSATEYPSAMHYFLFFGQVCKELNQQNNSTNDNLVELYFIKIQSV